MQVQYDLELLQRIDSSVKNGIQSQNFRLNMKGMNYVLLIDKKITAYLNRMTGPSIHLSKLLMKSGA